jgi:hypothetical protein
MNREIPEIREKFRPVLTGLFDRINRMNRIFIREDLSSEIDFILSILPSCLQSLFPLKSPSFCGKLMDAFGRCLEVKVCV